MHLKAIISWILFQLCLVCLTAQTTFEKTYFWNATSADHALNSGYIQTCGILDNPLLVITDDNGDYVAGKKFSFAQDAMFTHVQTDVNGSYVLSGTLNNGANASSAFVFVLDANAQVLWSGFQANGGNNRGLWAERTADGGIATCGVAEAAVIDGKGFLAKYNANGIRDWSKTYSWSGQDKFNCVKEVPGGYIVCGMVALEPSNVFFGEPKGFLLLMKTDVTGNPLWTKIIRVTNHTGAITKGRLTEVLVNSQGIFAGGYVTDELITEGVMIHCDASGNNLIVGTYSSNGFCSISGMGSLTEDGHGNILSAGGGYFNGCNFFDVYKIRPDLSIVWSKRYQGLAASWNMTETRTIRKAPDGGYILSSGSLLKIDTAGEINCATWQSLQKNPCTWDEPVYVLQQGTILSIATPAFTTSDTIINPQINCNDTTYASNGCNNAFSVNISATTLCAGECIQLTSDLSNSTVAGIFQWTFNGAVPDHSDVEDPGNVCYDQPGMFQIVFNGTGSCADTSITVTIQVNSIDPILHDVTGCAGDTVVLDAGIFPGAQYHWSTGANTPQISATVSGYYAVTVSNGDCSGTAASLVTLSNPPVLSLPTELTVCTGDQAQILAGDGSYQYTWSNGNQGALLTTSLDGTYYVTATNACGQTSDSVLISILENCDNGEIFIPNSFAPNSNGLNDIFTAQGENISSFSMQIYDRWGELLFTSNDVQQGWDGNYQGKPCKHDAYVYRITYVLNNDAEKVRLGKVMLIR